MMQPLALLNGPRDRSLAFVLWIAFLLATIRYLVVTGPPALRIAYFLTGMIFLVGGSAVLHQILIGRDVFGILPWSLAYFILPFGAWAGMVFADGSVYVGEPPSDEPTRAALGTALLYANIGLMAFLLACHSPVAVALMNRMPVLPRRWSVPRARIAIGAFGLLGVLANVVLTERLGGVRHYLLSKQQVLSSGMQGNFLAAPGRVVAVGSPPAVVRAPSAGPGAKCFASFFAHAGHAISVRKVQVRTVGSFARLTCSRHANPLTKDG